MGDPDVDGRITLRSILNQQIVRTWAAFISLTPMARCCVNGNERSVFIKFK